MMNPYQEEDTVPAHAHPRKDEIIELAKERLTPKQIGIKTGIHYRVVEGIVYRARRNKELPPLVGRRSIKHAAEMSGLTFGQAKSVLADLDVDQRWWLYNECTKLGVNTVMEYLLELVRDAYEEARTKDQ